MNENYEELYSNVEPLSDDRIKDYQLYVMCTVALRTIIPEIVGEINDRKSEFGRALDHLLQSFILLEPQKVTSEQQKSIQEKAKRVISYFEKLSI